MFTKLSQKIRLCPQIETLIRLDLKTQRDKPCCLTDTQFFIRDKYRDLPLPKSYTLRYEHPGAQILNRIFFKS